MAINENWNIRSRSHACHASGQPFSEGEVFITALFPSDGETLVREDYSLAGWESRPADAPVPFSSWRTVYVPPLREEKVEPVRKESAEELLRRLIEQDEPHTENARFILAVMLERQKLLRLADRNRIGTTLLLVYEHKKSGDVLIVRDPEIPLGEVDAIQTEVVALLEAGLGGGRAGEPGAAPEGAADSTPSAEAAPSASEPPPEPGDQPTAG